MAPSVFIVAFLRHAHPVLDLGEGLFDGVEVGRIGRQEPKPGVGGPDGLSDGFRFVASEIVHDDDVSGPQDLDELLFDVGPEADAVDRAVEDAGCYQAITAKRRQKGHGAPMAVRCVGKKALALWSPSPDGGHVGLDPGLVDEHQALGIEPVLPTLPTSPAAGNRRPRPLKGEQRFF